MGKRGKRAEPFKSLTRIKQFMRSPVKIKNRHLGGFLNILPEVALPSGKIPDGIFLQAGLAVFALRERCPFIRANKNIAAPFKSLTRIKQFMRSPVKIKNRHLGGFLNILPGKGLEPLSPKGQWFLRPSCIPIPAPRRKSFVLRKSYIFILANFMLKRKSFL